jgi:hypothetical protein
MESLCSKSEVFDVENNLAKIVLTEHISTKQFKNLVNTLQETGADISTNFSSGEIKIENGLNRVPGEENSDTVDELETELQVKKEKLQKYQEDIDELEEENLDLEQRNELLNDKAEDLQERVDELESKLEEERSGTDSKKSGENLELNGENKDSEEKECPYCGEMFGAKGIGPHKRFCDGETEEEEEEESDQAEPPEDDSDGKYTCAECGKSFEHFVKTRSTHHDCNGEDELKDSEESFNQDPEDQRSLEQEDEKEDLENEIECEICGFEAGSENEFESHDCEEEAEEGMKQDDKNHDTDDASGSEEGKGAWSDPDLVSDNPIFGLEKYERFECQCGSRFTSDVEAHEHDSECGQYEWRIWFNKLEEVEAAVDIEDQETAVKA